ncbi:hypothetical protein [Cellulomonas aerilata]|uniref:Uncharacterized protein n=1 Tax=Cellulomonas aerilata TaxID=515326 RepID=A0A512D7F4_9CELL|nr:hypothetical protein [Cellulomonas aerilata]GEO32401.1 hypothetical protein CAE01nite_01260 [Cellulomonas aerilata]
MTHPDTVSSELPADVLAGAPALPSDPDRPDPAHQPPEEVDEATVRAVGKVTAALEVAEHARGNLYAFHRLIGRADNELQEALDELEEAGHGDLADAVRAEVVGRNVLEGRWSFQVVEDFDDNYWSRFREAERTVRDRLVGGRRHVYESSMKERNRTHGRRGHEARPGEMTPDA